MCVFYMICLLLANTQWCENQTKLETSDKKTILQFLTAIQTPELSVWFWVSERARERLREGQGVRKKWLKNRKDNE